MSDPNEVVISGVGGLFPESDNFEQLEENLFNKINMVTKENPRWKPGELGVPCEIGKIKDPHTCDYTLFGIYSKLCAVMETNIRLVLLASFNAICDAGINPRDLAGTKTAVVMSSGLCETEYTCITGHYNLGQGMLGHSKTMEANRISYFLNTKGPSLVINSTWNGGMHALKVAKDLVQRGEVPAAIVGASSTTINRSEVSYHFDKMGRLDREGKTKSFSADASGYARSEACVVFLLQRACDAYRSYGTVLDVVCQSNYSMKTELILTNTSLNVEMIKRMHEESGVDPSEVEYIEGYGGASPKIDANELNIYATVYSGNRESPLLVGSVMSNLGHCEFASSFVSLAKALIILKNGMIPPNLHYSSPNPDVPALINNTMKVVTEATPFHGSVIGVGSVGVTGEFSYALLRRNPKVKLHRYKLGELPVDGMPRLVVMSGRTSDALHNSFEKIINAPIDEERVDLINKCFARKINKNLFRGYAVLDGSDDSRQVIEAVDDIEWKPIWFVFSGMGSQWSGMGKDLMRLPLFAKAINKCDAVLRPKGLDIVEIITADNPKTFENILHSFVGIAAVQIALVDVLKELGIEPDGLVGHSVGELGCAYADGCFTAEQMILAAYARGKASLEAKLIKGMMAAVGMSYAEIKNQLPPSIQVACHNSSTSCTLSGPTEDMEIYINALKSNGVFAKLVNVSNIAYHSRYIKPAAPRLLQYLKETIPAPKKRSKRWISSSIVESKWDSELAQYSSAEYHTNNLLSAVLFEEACRHIPHKAIVIEIAPHGLMQSIVKKSLPKCVHIPLTNRYDKDGLKFLLNAVGKTFLQGVKMDLSKLFPPVDYPVSRETPFIHPLVTCDNSTSFKIELDFMSNLAEDSPHYKSMELQISDNQWTTNKRFIHSQTIIPLAYLLDSVKTFFETYAQPYYYLVIEDVKVCKILEIRDELKQQMDLVLQRGMGNFEITSSGQSGELIASGKISYKNVFMCKENNDGGVSPDDTLTMDSDQFYDRLKQFGYTMDEALHHIKEMKVTGKSFEATVQWTGDFPNFLESIFTLIILHNSIKHNKLHVISSIKLMSMDSKKCEGPAEDIRVYYNSATNILSCDWLSLHHVLTEPCKIRPKIKNCLSQPLFYPLTGFVFKNEDEFLCAMLHIVVDNLSLGETGENKISKLSIISSKTNSLVPTIQQTVHFENNLEVRFLCRTGSDGGLYVDSENWGNEAILLIVGEGQAEKVALEVEENSVPFVLAEYDKDILKLNDLTLISDCFVGCSRYLLLKRKEEESRFGVIVNTQDANWEDKLRDTENRVCLVAKIASLTDIFEVTNSLDRTESTSRIQCFFVDEKSPPFSLQNEYYSNQLKKNLKINVSNNGHWDTLTYVQYRHTGKLLPAKRTFKVPFVKNSDIKIVSIGLNSPVSETRNEENQDWPSRTVEFSGITSKTGSAVMGLGSLAKSGTLNVDEILIWSKPSQWSHDESTTLLTAYAMASYIQHLIEENYDEDLTKEAIVHRGLLPLSQAVINLLSAASWRIITTCKSEDEKKKLKKMYPTMNEEQFCSYENHEFYGRGKAMNIKGVAVVVNTLEDRPDLLAYSIKCLRQRGLFFLVNAGESGNRMDEKMGMYPFFRENNVIGVSPQTLLHERNGIKAIVRKKVDNAIQSGTVKPFAYRTISGPSLNHKMTSKAESNSVESEALVVSFSTDTNADENVSICDPQKAYLVLGETSSHYVAVMDYLVIRGAKTIYTDMDTSAVKGVTEKMLMSLVENYPDVVVNLISPKKLRSKNSLFQLIQDVETSSKIGGLFFLGMGINEMVAQFDEALHQAGVHCLMTCIGNGGETIYRERQRRGLDTLCVRCNLKTIASSTLKHNLDDMLLSKTPFFELRDNFPVLTTESSARSTRHLPRDLSELLLYKKLKMEIPSFVELETASPRYCYAKEIDPVFFIPGFRHSDVHQFAKKMFYPAFEARLPFRMERIEQVAEALCQELRKFSMRIFTLVADSSGGVLAFHLANCLEAEGKRVSLILLNAAPYNIKNWLADGKKVGKERLARKYVRAPQKETQLESNYGKFTVTTSTASSCHIDEVDDAIRMVQDHENALLSSTEGKMFAGQCTYIRPATTEETNKDIFHIQKMCSRKVRVRQCIEADFQKSFETENIAEYVNMLVPVDYKDSVRDLDFEEIETF